MRTAEIPMPAISAPMSIDRTLGFILLSVILSTALWATSTTQLVYYSLRNSKRDKSLIKLLIYGLWIFDAIHQATLGTCLYSSYERDSGDVLHINYSNGFINTVLVSASITLLVKSFFVMQIWQCNRCYFTAGMFSTIFVAQFATAAFYFGHVSQFSEVIEIPTVASTTGIILSFSVVADTLAVIAVILLLSRDRARSWDLCFLLRKIIAYTVAIGLLCVTWRLMSLVSSLDISDSFVYLLISFIMPKVYLNCMFAFINCHRDDSSEFVDLLNCNPDRSTYFLGNPIEINVDVQTTQEYEDEKDYVSEAQ